LEEDESVSLMAAPNPGYTFVKWTVSTECALITYKNAASTTVRLSSGNDTVRAVFIPSSRGLTPVNQTILGRLETGVNYSYYTGEWTTFPDFSKMVPDRSDSCGSIDLAVVPHHTHNFGIVFNGYIDIPIDGDYAFYVKSSDGCVLILNDSVIIGNNGIHEVPAEEYTTVSLATGKYLLTVRYFNMASEPACTLSYACPSIGIEKQVISNEILSRPYTGPVSKIVITQPMGGEIFHLGDSLHVRWIYRHFDHMVICGLSTDNGKSYEILNLNAIAHTDTNGRMDWKIAVDESMITDQARVKVWDYAPGSNFCISNPFSIDSAIEGK
jgi:hypothetical protein